MFEEILHALLKTTQTSQVIGYDGNDDIHMLAFCTPLWYTASRHLIRFITDKL